jgi:peptidoglycan/xylan/chitin deacetylase (PgdA/CDA1 family)
VFVPRGVVSLLVVGGFVGVFVWSGFFGRSYLIVTAFWLTGAGCVGLAVRHRVGPLPRVVLSIGLLAALGAGAVSWHVVTDPQSQLLGASITHGSRSEGFVALTFDDGPNYETTLAVRDTLDAYGVKGTFFVVAGAVAEAPEITRALVADGHLVANHAESHNTLGWLSPFYRQASVAERTLFREVGVCPRFFRPPHGYHTPFVARAVRSAEMDLVEWDVSAHDWDTTDADLVATRVLANVRAGSIVLLHDGLDGDLVSDRSVVVRALPKILAGLHDLDLQPVRLDQLLHQDGYLATCS